MKTLKYILLAVSALFISGCNTLDVENIYNYDAELVWNDENLVNSYLADLYNRIYGEPSNTSDTNSEQMTGIYWYADRVSITNGEGKLWDYTNIRKINDGLQEIESCTLDQDFKDNIKGQLLFLRGYLYSKMVFRHGGVPYITVPQDRETDDLYVSRNTTAECFDLISKDIDEAITLLPEYIPSSSSDFGKVHGAYALAYKAGVLLWKASPVFHPGNPYGNPDWQAAYNASKEAYDKLTGYGYGLEPEFKNIFLNEGGPETVFSVIAIYPNKTFNYLAWGARPGSEARAQASCGITWEYAKDFLMKDGKRWNDPSSEYYTGSDETGFAQHFWENRDDRFYASLLWNGALYEAGGKSGNRQYTALGLCNTLDDFGTNPNASINSTNLDRYSGIFQRKFDDLKLSQATSLQYDIDWIVLRFAEVILNYAEAANETGNTSEAIGLLKQIRERAGIEAGADGTYGIGIPSREQLRELILAERNIEFGFEGKRYDDLRRLREIGRLHNSTKHGLEAIAVNPDGTETDMGEALTKCNAEELTESDFKYVIHQIPFSGVKVNEIPDVNKYAIYPIQQSVLEKNPKIEQNSNWGGTFNPTLE
ncbi:MAG: RagB/SusD family nutrient uptake outer membrane protein [Tannerella sp.]|jgi:hypothetical protein|nr:RagB/SusD family nutrient uptake outer membrane protein [Tannerella sp.]